MVFTVALLNVLLATAAFAAPRSNLNSRVARRRMSGPRLPATGVDGLAITNVTSDVEYSSNWAGAVFDSAAGSYTAVKGTFVVPTPKSPSSSTAMHSASAWVGIDGDTCGTAILQTGVDFTIEDGEASYDAWYEYYPAVSHDFSGITIHAGDTITVSVIASSSTSGTAEITNETTGKTVSKKLSSSAKLCGQNAEWIVEDFEEGSSLVPFANFGTVTFTSAEATMSSGSTVGPSGATLIDIKQSSKALTSVSTTSSTVKVSYV
ncbi:peptidase A4 family-domain-containing protein [Mycena sp. CBHHK59/15]|nr:peptidase A4 family-domain-containing protein [Mycena sp. CBHHK59/15]